MIDLTNIDDIYKTNQIPLDAYIAHLNHICSPQSLKPILNSRHNYTTGEASNLSKSVCHFIQQALHFHHTSKISSSRIRPVIQYYSYLNLAVACVLIYKPKDWNAYRRHGAEELSRTKKRISLTTPAVKVSKGALSLFSRIVSDSDLTQPRLRLIDLLVPIHMSHCELASAYKVHCDNINVKGRIARPQGKDKGWVSKIELAHIRNEKNKRHKFPVRRVHKLLPMLVDQYKPISRNADTRIYESIQVWSENNKARAKIFHINNIFKASNIGGHSYDLSSTKPKIQMDWYTRPNSPLMSTATASLLLSFYLSSLARYRPNIVERAENSKINLLLEVFSNESDGYMIPLFRNLLYREMIILMPSEYY